VKRTVSALEARRRLGELLESVFYKGDEVTIERAGKVMGVIVPAERYEAMQRSRQRMMELLEKNWEHNKNVPYEVIEREVSQTVSEMRGAHRPKRTKSAKRVS
jgi:prevent-host-death family protein